MSTQSMIANVRLQANACPDCKPGDRYCLLEPYPDLAIEDGKNILAPEQPVCLDAEGKIARKHWEGKMHNDRPYFAVICGCFKRRITGHYFDVTRGTWIQVLPTRWRKHVAWRFESRISSNPLVEGLFLVQYKEHTQWWHKVLRFPFVGMVHERLAAVERSLFEADMLPSVLYKDLLQNVVSWQENLILYYIFKSKRSFLRLLPEAKAMLEVNESDFHSENAQLLERLISDHQQLHLLQDLTYNCVKELYNLRLKSKSRAEQVVRLTLAHALKRHGREVPPEWLVGSRSSVMLDKRNPTAAENAQARTSLRQLDQH